MRTIYVFNGFKLHLVEWIKILQLFYYEISRRKDKKRTTDNNYFIFLSIFFMYIFALPSEWFPAGVDSIEMHTNAIPYCELINYIRWFFSQLIYFLINLKNRNKTKKKSLTIFHSSDFIYKQNANSTLHSFKNEKNYQHKWHFMLLY